MIFQGTGEVVPGFHVLGDAHIPTYLLDAPRPVLFDSGISALAGRYVADVRQVLGSRQPHLLCLTHAHFDHCGAASALKAAFPELRVAASAQASEILTRPRALEVIRDLNRQVGAEEYGGGPAFEAFEVDRVLRDGDRIDLGGGRSLDVLATPGHTRDFLSYFEPSRRLLVASEAAGCSHVSGAIAVEFVSDYDAYLGSIRRLLALDATLLCQGHDKVYVGEDVSSFLRRSLEATERYCAWVESLLAEENGDVGAVVTRIQREEWAPLGLPKQPERPYLLNTEARVRHLASRRRP